jgi:hypothetical protein
LVKWVVDVTDGLFFWWGISLQEERAVSFFVGRRETLGERRGDGRWR